MKTVLTVENISKSFAGVQALKKVSMSINQGETHCLVGENGSGKSTLIKIIAGILKRDEGKIFINGKEYKNLRAIEAIKEGIQIIYQDLSLFPNLTVAENISLSQLVEKSAKITTWQYMANLANEELAKLEVKLEIDTIVDDLSVANKQIVAICRALTQNTKLIIMDEPTTALTRSEIEALFSIIYGLKDRGISTLFVSHKLSEVLKISEKVSIIRDGEKVGTYDRKEVDNEKLIFYMTGKSIDVTQFRNEGDTSKGIPLLKVKGLTKKGNFEKIDFELRTGEILGIAGLLGSGRTELALSLFGLNKADAGEIFIEGKLVEIDSPTKAIKLGISYLPEDRLGQGLFIDQSIENNIVVTIISKLLNKFKLVISAKKKKVAEDWKRNLAIKTNSISIPVKSLSGGNQQRVVIAKWLAVKPKIFILDSPTVGIDVSSKDEIHKVIRKLAKDGMGVIVISDEASEIIHNCNRTLIMCEGKIIEETDTNDLTEDEIFKKISTDHSK